MKPLKSGYKDEYKRGGKLDCFLPSTPVLSKSLEEMSKTPAFLSLTTRQKLCFATYISNGYDIINAVRTAYACKDDKTAKIMSYRFFRCFNIVMALSLHFGDTPQEKFLTLLTRDLVKSKLDKEKVKAYSLYAQVMGWKKTSLVRAMELAKEIGIRPSPTRVPDETRSNLKQKIAGAIRKRKKEEAKAEWDLSKYEAKKAKLGYDVSKFEKNEYDLGKFEGADTKD
jgi:hypothetical protein